MFAFSRPFHARPGSRVILVATSIAAISLLHHLIPLSMLTWHNVLQQLYYLPIVFAGLSYGWKGGVAAALFATLSHVPHIWETWQHIPNYSEDQVTDIVTFCLAGGLTGIGAERESRHRAVLERTTRELSRVYQELQDNFENMKRAERLYAVGQLSAGLAHEIRNPLASIAGAVGILKRHPAEESKRAECLAIIARECDRLNGLLKEFLDFARPRAPRYQTVEMDAVIASVIELASHAIGHRPVIIRKSVAPGIPAFDTDAPHVTQALLNLLINAVQASPDGGEITVSAAVDNDRAVIRVRDQGKGVAPDDMDRIFDPFFTTKEFGSGLGLPVAHQIVRQLGGLITAERNADSGMTFLVQLPLRKGTA